MQSDALIQHTYHGKVKKQRQRDPGAGRGPFCEEKPNSTSGMTNSSTVYFLIATSLLLVGSISSQVVPSIRLTDVVVGVHTSVLTAQRAEFLVSSWFPLFPNRLLTVSDSKDTLCSEPLLRKVCDEATYVEPRFALSNLYRANGTVTLPSTIFTTLLRKASLWGVPSTECHLLLVLFAWLEICAFLPQMVELFPNSPYYVIFDDDSFVNPPAFLCYLAEVSDPVFVVVGVTF